MLLYLSLSLVFRDLSLSLLFLYLSTAVVASFFRCAVFVLCWKISIGLARASSSHQVVRVNRSTIVVVAIPGLASSNHFIAISETVVVVVVVVCCL